MQILSWYQAWSIQFGVGWYESISLLISHLRDLSKTNLKTTMSLNYQNSKEITMKSLKNDDDCFLIENDNLQLLSR